MTGVYQPSDDGDGSEVTYEVVRSAVGAATKRNKITPEFLARVAEIHNNAPERTRTHAVMTEFGVDQRTAFRYIAAARERNLIDNGNN